MLSNRSYTMASSGNGPQQSQHVQGAAEGLFARVKQVASGILAEVSRAGTPITATKQQTLVCTQACCLGKHGPELTCCHQRPVLLCDVPEASWH